MARINLVQRAGKSSKPRRCLRCGHEVQVGESYKHSKPRYGATRIWCFQHSPRPSETSSSKMADAWAAAEGVEDSIQAYRGGKISFEDLKADAESAADEVERVGEEYGEGSSNIEDGFGHATSASEAMAEAAEECSSAADTLRSAFDNIEEPEESEEEEAEEVDLSELESALEEVMALGYGG